MKVLKYWNVFWQRKWTTLRGNSSMMYKRKKTRERMESEFFCFEKILSIISLCLCFSCWTLGINANAEALHVRLGKARACLWVTRVQEVVWQTWDCSGFCSLLSFHVSFCGPRGNPAHAGFSGDTRRIQSGLEEQLMVTPVGIPVKWLVKGRTERFR